jgi:hypothetical protein
MSSAAMDKFSRVVFRSKSADSEMAFLNALLNKEFKSIPQESGACVWETYVKQIDKLFASVDQHLNKKHYRINKCDENILGCGAAAGLHLRSYGRARFLTLRLYQHYHKHTGFE